MPFFDTINRALKLTFWTVWGGEYVEKGEPIARILDTYSAHVLSEITSPVDGTIGFSSSSPLIHENTTIFKIIKDEDI